MWPVLLAFTAVPSLVATIFLPFVPESPRYLLVNKNNEEKAKQGKNKRCIMNWNRGDVRDGLRRFVFESLVLDCFCHVVKNILHLYYR